MANRSQAEFVRQMLRLRSQIQCRTPHELYEQAGMVEYHMSRQPKVYDERYVDMANNPLITVRTINFFSNIFHPHRPLKSNLTGSFSD